MSSTSPLRIGVLIVPPVQLLDVSSVDLFGMLTKEYLEACSLPAPLLALGIPVEIHYISEAGPGIVAECTANARLRVTADLEDEVASAGKIDILMIPGPDPAIVPSIKVQDFIRSHVNTTSAIMTVCTGIFPAAYSGILKGKHATGPRAPVQGLKTKFPDTKWEEKRWVRDGNIWCSGGITNGQDMVAAYIRKRWPGPLAETVLAMADVGGRSVEYDSGSAKENLWWLWQILRAWTMGLKK